MERRWGGGGKKKYAMHGFEVSEKPRVIKLLTRKKNAKVNV